MNETFITASNVYDTAQVMMELDMTFIQPPFQKDAEPFIRELCISLENFKHPFKNSVSGSYSLILLFDEHLTALLKATQNFYAILSDEGKALLQKSINLKIKELKETRETQNGKERINA